MEYENKRKEEIIRAIQLWGHGDITRECLEYIFPELKESEDERIRKELMEFLFSNRIICNDLGGIDIDKTLTWLKKQGKQKPKWSDEDEIGSDATIELLEYFINYAPEFRKPTIRRSIDWLNSLKKRMEDELCRKNIQN